MSKKKCAHCGYSFKPRNESETICEACRIQLRDDTTASGHRYEFDVKCHGLYSFEIKGKLLLSAEKVVFEPKEVYLKHKKLEMELSKIKDVRFTTEKEISALRVGLIGVTFGALAGATLGALVKKKHHLLTIDFEDETGILQHPIFEGSDMNIALEEINEIRKNHKKAEDSKNTKNNI